MRINDLVLSPAEMARLSSLIEPLMYTHDSAAIAQQLRVETRVVVAVRHWIKQGRSDAHGIHVARLYGDDEARHVVPRHLMAWPAPKPAEMHGDAP